MLKLLKWRRKASSKENKHPPEVPLFLSPTLAEHGLRWRPLPGHGQTDCVICRQCKRYSSHWTPIPVPVERHVEFLPWFHHPTCEYHALFNKDAKSLTDIFPKLDTRKDQLRLLHILPGTEPELIHCNLEIRALDEKPEYETLSYDWADVNYGRPCFVMLDGKLWLIAFALWQALSRLRLRSSSRIFWIDALCINPLDDAEKTYHACMTSRVYSQCQQTLVWLGEPYFYDRFFPQESEPAVILEGLDADHVVVQNLKATNVSFDEKNPLVTEPTFEKNFAYYWNEGVTVYEYLLEKHFASALCLLHHIWKDDHFSAISFGQCTEEEHDSLWRYALLALNKMLDSPWWEQTWVVQEVQLSPKSVICWGRNQFPLQYLLSAGPWLEKHRSTCCSGFWQSLPLLQRKAFDKLVDTVGSIAFPEKTICESLTTPMIRFLDRRAYEPREKIFRVLGLLYEPYQKLLSSLTFGIPDYNLTLAKALGISTYIMLQEQHDRQILALTNLTASEKLQIPSWAPAWSSLDQFIRYRFLRCGEFNASKSLSKVPRAAANYLVVANHGIGTIARVGSVEQNINVGLDIPKTIEGWKSLAGLDDKGDRTHSPKHCACRPSTAEARHAAFLRTLTQDISSLGPEVGEASQRASLEHVQELKELLEWGKLHPEDFRLDKLPKEFAVRYQDLTYAITQQRFFVTTDGLYGLGPAETAVGDEVRILLGSDVPFVVRPLDPMYRWKHTCCWACTTDDPQMYGTDHLIDPVPPSASPSQSYLSDCKRRCLARREEWPPASPSDRQQPYAEVVASFLATWTEHPATMDATRKALEPQQINMGLALQAVEYSVLPPPTPCTHKLVGSCYVHGIMDGEALGGYSASLDEDIRTVGPVEYDRIILS